MTQSSLFVSQPAHLLVCLPMEAGDGGCQRLRLRIVVTEQILRIYITTNKMDDRGRIGIPLSCLVGQTY